MLVKVARSSDKLQELDYMTEYQDISPIKKGCRAIWPIVLLPNWWSLVAHAVANNDKVGIMKTLGFHSLTEQKPNGFE